jgi:predicted lipid-binding transport protein (Tim44 family)
MVLSGLKRVAEEEDQPEEAKVLDQLESAFEEVLAQAESDDARSLPKYVDASFFRYLKQPRDQDPWEQAKRLEEAWRRQLREQGTKVEREPEDD